MDVKGVTASVFHPYHSVDFDTPMGGILHASADTSSTARSNCNNFQAEMAASLQQQMMQQMASIGMHQHAMHHYGVSHPAGVPSVSGALYPSAMSSQGMALMGTAGLANEIGGHGVGGTSFLSPFSHQPQQQGGAGAETSAVQQQHRQQQQHATAPLRAQTGQGSTTLSMPSVLPSSSAFPPSMVPGLSVLGGVVKPSSQLSPSQQQQQQQRYPLLHGAHLADLDTDPRELERFAEHFKQRRIKLGVTQADVGKALAYLKMPGVGSLSQSTICRFESLTLSHNNMVALKPILHSWLERAEEATKSAMAKENGRDEIGGIIHCAGGILPCVEKKRKRTSIAAPEKRMLEEFFRHQSRPTGDRISAIADKLDLKKNVVRVWFCNQRQKQKRDRNQFRHCRNGVGGGSSTSIAAAGNANGGGIGVDANQQQQQTSICAAGGNNSQQLMANSLTNSTAAATLAAAAMQAMQQQQQNNNSTATQLRLLKQSQQNDIYGEALIKGTMAQLQTTISSAEEMPEQKASTEIGRIEQSGDNACGVIRHGFSTKARKMTPPDETNDGVTDSRMMETMEMFGGTTSSATIFYLNGSRERIVEN